MMEKRRIIIGDYDTAENGWTLAAWTLGAAKQKTDYVEKPGGDGDWDMSTVLSDGIPRYHNRELSVRLEGSWGDRMDREEEIRRMVNALDGLRWDIQLPDDPDHHITGRVHVAKEYNDLAHAAVTVTAMCDPWKYNNIDTLVEVQATTAEHIEYILNRGRRTVTPVVEVENTTTSVRLVFGNYSWSLGAGRYQLPDLLLTPGAHQVTISGAGFVRISYREAVLE